jgi:hypothetical protein
VPIEKEEVYIYICLFDMAGGDGAIYCVVGCGSDDGVESIVL